MKNQHLIKYKNPVLIKDQQGKVKQTTFDLPDQTHAYGKKVQDDPQPIKYIVNGWQTSSQAPEKQSKKKDFKELNKLATKNGLFTAKEQTNMRKTNDIMVQTKKGQKIISILLPQQNFSYGVANRPSTPIKLVVGNCYALEQDQKNAQLYQTAVSREKSRKEEKVSAKTTKSQQLRQKKSEKTKQYRNGALFEQKFKMTKFTSTQGPRIDTNLSSFQKIGSSIVNNKQQKVN